MSQDWFRDVLAFSRGFTCHQMKVALMTDAEGDHPAADNACPPGVVRVAMEFQPFGHYDHLMLMFRNDQDFQQACELLGIKKVAITYPGGLQKTGIGRVIDGPKAIQRIMVLGPSGPRAGWLDP